MAFKISNVNIIDDTRNLLSALDGSFTGIVTASRFISNVAQGTAPISVASSTLVTNLNANFLNGFPGAYYQVANNLTGQAPASVITQSNGLIVSGNLNVSGNVTIGGTTTQLNAQQLQINDRDITLGVTTDVNGNDVSTDITANHGGISIASTVGTPLIGIPTDAVNNSPSTYKQIMWIRQNHYSGLGTDAWVFNYGVSIGNTATVQNGSRLTVGAGFTVYDALVDLQDIRARNIIGVNNINATGIVTANSFRGDGSQLTGITAGGVGAISGVTIRDEGLVVGTAGSVTSINFVGNNIVATASGIGATITISDNLVGSSLNISGLSTLTTLVGTNINYTGIGTVTTLNSTVATLTNLGGTNINYTGVGTVATFNATTSTVTNRNGTNLNISGIGTVTTLNSTVATLTNLGGTNINYTGVGTVATLNSTVATLTNLGGTNLNYSGIGTIANISNTNINSSGINTAAQFNVGATTILSTVSGQIRLSGIQTIDATTKAALERELAFAPNSFDDLLVAGISTFSNGPVLIGSGTSTGTVTQRLQVTGGGYISTSTGIGITNPSQLLDVGGNLRVRGGIYDVNNNVGAANSVLTANGSGGWSWQSVGSIGGNTVTVTNDTSTTTPLFPIFTNSTGASITGVSVDSVGLSYIPSGAGSLGIGTTSPTQNLDVNGNARFRGSIFDNSNLSGTANQVLTAGPSGAGVTWATLTAASVGAISGINVSQDDTGIRYPLLAAGANATTTLQYVDATALAYNTSTNCLGIGSLTPTSRLDIVGDVKVLGIITATDFNSSSDRTLKHDIQVIENPIEKVLQLNGVTFNWNETGKPSVGVIAQEVEQVLPELVSDTEPKSVNYNGLIGLLIECVKEQQKQIDELKAKKTTRRKKTT